MIIDPHKIIINRRDLRGRRDGLTSACLLLAFWGLMLYLARPLAAFAGWPAAEVDQPAFLPALLARCLPLVAGLSLSLIGWAWYNRLRFGGLRDQRRGESPGLTLREIAANAPFGRGEVRVIRRTRVSFFFFNDKGEVIAVKCREATADTDSTLSRAAALAPRVAAGSDPAQISDGARVPTGAQRLERPAPGPEGARLPRGGDHGRAARPEPGPVAPQLSQAKAAPLARPLRPVVTETAGRVIARPLRPVPAGMEGLLISRPRPAPETEGGSFFRRLPIAAALAGINCSGGV